MTDKAREMIEGIIAKKSWNLIHYSERMDTADAILAALPEIIRQNPSIIADMVPDLVWEVFDAETAWARSPFGTYRYDAPKLTLSTQKNYVGDGLGNWRMGSVDAAKAAAQADYADKALKALGMKEQGE